MLGLGSGELIAIVVVIFLLFGATRLPQLAKSLGQSRKAFKDGMREAEEEEKAAESSKLSAGEPAPAAEISAISDDEVMAEMRRRAESKS